MTRSDKSIIALALVPNGTFVLGLLGWMVERMASGRAPLPNGSLSVVMGLCVIVPLASIGLANFIRLRRDATDGCAQAR
jgi:hypothetical protein